MLPIFIAIAVVVAAVALWTISTQRKLVILDENINSRHEPDWGAVIKPF